MAYEELGDVVTVVLGGVNKKTGRKNPLQLEGYFLRVESRPNKFNPTVPQKLYVFQTEKGEEGLFGKAGIDREMKKAVPGRMTLVVDTEQVLDTGKGNPMKVFKVMQDKTNTIDVDSINPLAPAELDESMSEDDSDAVEEAPVYHAPVAPAAPRPVSSPASIQRTRALLSGKR